MVELPIDRETSSKEILTPEQSCIVESMRFATRELLVQYLAGSMSERKAMLDSDNFEELLEIATATDCIQASQIAANYIEENNKDIFKYGWIFTGYRQLGKPFRRLKDERHGYLLVEDQKGLVYGCSPANYGVVSPDYLLTIYEFDSVQEGRGKIAELEGGNWSGAPTLYLPKENRVIPAETVPSGIKVKAYRKRSNVFDTLSEEKKLLIVSTLKFLEEQSIHIVRLG